MKGKVMKKFLHIVGILLLASTLHADDNLSEIFDKCLKGDKQACKKFLIKNRIGCNQNNESARCTDLALTYKSSYKHLFYPNISEYEALKNHLRLEVKACMLGGEVACERLEEKKMELEPYSGDFYTLAKKMKEQLLDLQKLNFLLDKMIGTYNNKPQYKMYCKKNILFIQAADKYEALTQQQKEEFQETAEFFLRYGYDI